MSTSPARASRRMAVIGVSAVVLLLVAVATWFIGTRGDGSGDSPAASGKIGDITVTDVAVLQSTVDVAGAYFAVRNTGSDADELLGVSVDASVADSAGMHETVSTATSSSMPMIERLAIPPGATVRFETGGYHVMLEGVRAPLEPGDRVVVRFTFARAGTMELVAPVWSYTRSASSSR